MSSLKGFMTDLRNSTSKNCITRHCTIFGLACGYDSESSHQAWLKKNIQQQKVIAKIRQTE
jgi:hypothetical protein